MAKTKKRSKTIGEFLNGKIASVTREIENKVNSEYIDRRLQAMKDGEELPKLSKYKKTDEYNKKIKKEKEESKEYQYLTKSDILTDENFLKEYNKYKQQITREQKAKESRQKTKHEKSSARKEKTEVIYSFFYGNEQNKWLDDVVNELINKYKNKLENAFLNNKRIFVDCKSLSWDDEYCYPTERNLSLGSFKDLYHIIDEKYGKDNETLSNDMKEFILRNLRKTVGGDISRDILMLILKKNPEFKTALTKGDVLTEQESKDFYVNVSAGYAKDLFEKYIIKSLIDEFTIEKILNIIENNKHFAPKIDEYRKMYESIKEEEEAERRLRANIISTIPEDYVDLYPLARQMKRHFILHIGGTNSGKTYTAMGRMREVGEGIYLAPLRLLAYEQFDRLNKDGYFCTLLTGEEKLDVPFSTFQSSTIEMLDLSVHYKIAVIDEAQMVDDKFRGGSWTRAILGVLADEVHICAALEAEEVLKKMIEACGDDYEVQYHERNTKLTTQDEPFNSLKDVQKGDALIVFSRKSVHSVANDLKKMGVKCSIIYGALPYDVRQNEANKFANGTTDVVVTTDAIGMGLNLPIKRVVFLESTKFDGEKMRDLKSQEVKQIAGRAGRYKIFDEGFVNAYDDRDHIYKELAKTIPNIKEVFIRFPESLLGLESDLSATLEKWNDIKVKPGFKKADVTHEIKLSKIAERITSDKKVIYEFITIPYDDEDEELLELWKNMLEAYVNNIHLNFFDIKPIYPLSDLKPDDLVELEKAYKICDLIYYYNEKFEGSKDSAMVMHCKEEISTAIMKLLESEQFTTRKCKSCGKPLPWNMRFNVCEKCHRTHRY